MRKLSLFVVVSLCLASLMACQHPGRPGARGPVAIDPLPADISSIPVHRWEGTPQVVEGRVEAASERRETRATREFLVPRPRPMPDPVE